MRTFLLVLFAGASVLCAGLPAGAVQGDLVAQATGAAPAPKPAVGEAAAVTVRGTIAAIDKEKRTVTLKGPQGRTVTLDVRDPQKLDVVKVGDPVVARYYEAIVMQVRKANGAAPGTSTQETRVTSKAGETPAGAVAQQVVVTVTITAINQKQQTVTIRGPQGNTETFKVRDPKNLENVKVGDLVEITYTRALAVSLDKPASK